ncbi:hypothetical protein N7U66_02395 [Lacinutrix neustonica]|uniref:Uncharacterized protein n=1 Tax=Lacinutrix neustonica TaxID=2980107 RepID=A0A9E8SEQ6_9FLAO|nr:hypothetical protein [Lacinutrix neustonica]WAC02569.1 hypothetical protein N7U66_02395 [Lacinutrix neustonica]
MKKLVLLFTGLLMGLTTVTAAEKVESASQGEDLTSNRYRFDDPIQFIERGVEFLVFPDGSFDFNTNIDDNHNSHDEGYYRRSNTRRTSVNGTFGAPGTQVRFSTPRDRGVIITHDRDGKVRRIGNVFVNYNRVGQVKRLGSVYMQYNRQGWLTKVGGLHLKYNRRGQIIDIFGNVNFRNQGCGFCGVTGCSTSHYGTHDDNDWNDHNDNDDYYYYKKDGKVKKQKKLKKRK